MAELQGLYFGMGIDTGQLHSDFLSAEKTINQNLRRINQEMETIQLRGQLELEGLDESASQIEKVRIQEAALNEQIKLQQDKILLLNRAYEHLVETRGENAEASRQVELQLQREQYAMQKLETQMEDLENQTKLAFGMNFEMLGLIEPATKLIDRRVASGAALPLGLAPPQAKAAVAAFIALTSAVEGTIEATKELREENPAQLVDEDLKRLSGSIDNSWQKINESNRRGMEQVRSYNNGYYRNNYRNNYYGGRNRELQNYNKATEEQVEQIKENTQEIAEAKKEQDSVIENFLTDTLGIKKLKEGGLKILPEPNRDDIIRFSKVFEDYRFSESLTNAIDLIKGSDSVLGKLVSTMTTFTYLSQKVREPIVEFAQTALEGFRELSNVANELNLPIERANDLMSVIKLANAEYNDVRDYVRGVQDAVIKGDSEDPEVLALEKYGVVIQDANGKLLAFDETLDRLYQGYLKAKEAGEAEGYVMMTNGQAVQDVLPYFEKLADAKEAAAKIQWSTLDAATLGNVSQEMRLLEVQSDELKNALASLAAPAAEMALKDMFETVKGYTKLIEENRDTVIYWTYVLMEALKVWDDFTERTVKDKIQSLVEDIKPMLEEVKNFFSAEPPKDIAEEAKESLIPFYTELKAINEEFELMSKLERFLPEGFTAELDNAVNGYLVPFYEKIKSIEEELSITNKLKNAVVGFLPEDFGSLFGGEDSIFARAQEDFDEFKRKNEEARQQAEETKKYLAGLSYSLNRIAKYKSELESLELDIEFGTGDNYQKKIEQNKIWYEQAMKDAKQYADEQAIIEEVNAARLLKIEQEKEQKLAEIREKITAADRTELENRILAINREKDEWIKAGMEKAEASKLAQKQIKDYIEKNQKELSDTLTSIYNTELENRLAQIEKERQAWIDKCGDEVKATQLAEQQKADAQRNAAMLVLKQQAEEYEAYQQGGYAGLRAYKANQLAEQGINPKYLYMTPQELQEFKKASQVAEKSMLPNFMTEQDRAEHYQQMQDWQDWKKQRNAEIDERNYVIVDGVKTGLSEVLSNTPIEISLGKNDNEEDHTLRVSSEGDSYTRTDNKYSYDEQGRLTDAETKFRKDYLPVIQEPTAQQYTPENYSDISQPLIESFSELSSAVNEAATTLNELPNITENLAETAEQSITDSFEQFDLESFSELSSAVQGITEGFNELQTAVQGISENFSELAEPQIDSSINPFSDLEPIIQSAIQSFSEFGQEIPNVIQSISGMNSGFSEVTVRLSDLSRALANFILPQQNQNERVPVEVNTTVQIDEAHAWDYDHIQELADKVADIIRPEIISAIGGDSNSY